MMVMNSIKKSQGFSLVELLVAMLVGLIIVSGAFSLHSGSRKAQVKNEVQMDMVADARFAIELISYDLRHAGMWGGTNKDSLIDCKSTDAACSSTSAGDTPPSAMAGDCDVGWYYNLSRAIFATDDSAGNPYSATCIPASEGYLAGTDILEIKYADSNPPASLLANQAYIRSNSTGGRIFVGTTQPVLDSYDTSPLTNNHELHAFTYYISDHTDAAGDGIPSLRRVSLVNSPTLQNQLLVSGVANLQVQFGLDVDQDNTVDRYVNPGDEAYNPNAAGYIPGAKVITARVWMVVRGLTPEVGLADNRDYSPGDVDLGAFNDQVRRLQVSKTILLRNART